MIPIRLSYPYDDPFRDVGHYREVTTVRLGVYPHHQHEVPLVRVGFPFLPHVVRGRLAEVKSSDRGFGDLVGSHVHPRWPKQKEVEKNN